MCLLVLFLHMTQHFPLLFFSVKPVARRQVCRLVVELLLSSAGGLFLSLASQGEPLCASGTPRHGRKVKEVLGMQLMLSKAEREGKV